MSIPDYCNTFFSIICRLLHPQPQIQQPLCCTMSDWSELCETLLLLIVEKISTQSDYIRFNGVCSSWRSVAAQDRARPRPQPPGLMISLRRTQIFHFVPFSRINSRPQKQLPLPLVPQDSTCCGSHKGWLVMVDSHKRMHVLNPLNGVQITLPSAESLTHPDSFRSSFRAVLSSSPSIAPCFVLIFYGTGAVAYCKLGDKAWISMRSTDTDSGNTGYADAIYFKGQFYVVHCSGKLFVCDFSACNLRMVELPSLRRLEKRYLVESEGELLQVLRVVNFVDNHFGLTDERTKTFELYKLDVGNNKWVGVRDLGDRALFLGSYQSFSVSELDVRSIRGNRIYFTDDRDTNFANARHNMGVFNLQDSSIEPLHAYGLVSTRPSAVWLTPTPW